MRLPIAREGLPYLGAGLGISALTALASRRLALVPLAATALVAGFFRDPERTAPAATNVLLAAADGQIIHAELIDDAPFVGGPAWRIATFLSLFDVHINRSPADGTVRYRSYHPGRYKPAWDPDVDKVNERNLLGIETAHGPLLVVQISGAVARRIVCYPKVGERVARGERFGLIKFGSRTDLIFPATMARPLVRAGQRVFGGVTPLAVLI